MCGQDYTSLICRKTLREKLSSNLMATKLPQLMATRFAGIRSGDELLGNMAEENFISRYNQLKATKLSVQQVASERACD
jgi:hypothetical protein